MPTYTVTLKVAAKDPKSTAVQDGQIFTQTLRRRGRKPYSEVVEAAVKALKLGFCVYADSDMATVREVEPQRTGRALIYFPFIHFDVKVQEEE